MDSPVKYNRGGNNRYSPAIDAVAREVVATVAAGKLVNMGKIMRSHGYSPATSKAPSTLTSKKQYKEAIETYTSRLEKHRSNVLSAREKKDLDEEQYRTLADAQTKITHDVQLLSGGKTENVGLEQDRQTLKAIVAAIQMD